MSTIAEIKKELQSYIQQAIQIEAHNKQLTERVQLLESTLEETKHQLETEKVNCNVKLDQFKENWKKSTIEFVLQEKEKCFNDCNESIEVRNEMKYG